jgi:hypothetical protein
MRADAPSSEPAAPAAAGPATPGPATRAYPVCSQCGRDSFPLVGGWDPPICADCDAAINEDAIWSEGGDPP